MVFGSVKQCDYESATKSPPALTLARARLVLNLITQHGIKSCYQARISPWTFSSWDMALEEYGSLSYSFRESESVMFFMCGGVQMFPGVQS